MQEAHGCFFSQKSGIGIYTFASATAIHLTLIRLKENKSHPFEEIKDYLIEEYGKKVYQTRKLLDNDLWKY